MAVGKMRRRRISIRFAVVLRVWLGTLVRRSRRYVGRKMKMRVGVLRAFLYVPRAMHQHYSLMEFKDY